MSRSRSRATPFDLVFAPMAEERFPRIRAALAAAGREATDRDAFLIEREAVLLLRELRPEEGLGEGMDQLAALAHHVYVFWDSGLSTVEISPGQLAGLLENEPQLRQPAEISAAYYVQLPERRIWASIIAGQPPEPLDGCFVHSLPSGDLRVLGIFGLHSERMGFSVAEAAGPRPVGLRRQDGTPLFSPTMAGGAAARLYALTGGEEMLELGWRTTGQARADVGAGAGAGAGAMPWTR